MQDKTEIRDQYETYDMFDRMTDEEIVLHAQSGNDAAHEYLIRKFADVVRSKPKVYFIQGSDSEDVIQEAMIGLFKAIKTYDGKQAASFRTYAEQCINHQIYDAIKAANRKKHKPLNTSVSLSTPVTENGEQALEETIPGPVVEDPEVMTILHDVMSYIANNESGMFSDLEIEVWNQYMNGSSFAEIAEKTGKNQKAVYNAMERTKKKIRGFLADK